MKCPICGYSLVVIDLTHAYMAGPELALPFDCCQCAERGTIYMQTLSPLNGIRYHVEDGWRVRADRESMEVVWLS